jgi:membrane protease YdiL (CAAX protease family)
MFVALYIAVLAGGILAAGLSGLVDFTPESVILLILCGATVAAMLALHIHLIRRNRLSLGGLGFRRFRPRMLHLLWQIPSAIVISACLQGLFLAALTQLGIGSTSADSSNDTLAKLADLPTPFVVLGFLIVAVLTPLWEEVLFRGALLSGFSRRFRPFVAVVLSAALFAACHLVLLTFAYLFALGIALALVRQFHQNLWAPVLLHAVNNALVVLIVLAAS